jgi:hypothetical protein
MAILDLNIYLYNMYWNPILGLFCLVYEFLILSQNIVNLSCAYVLQVKP